MREIVESRKKKDEESVRLMEAQRQNILAEQFDRDVRTFTTPHDHLTGTMLDVILAHKRQIVAKHNWQCDF